MIISLYILGMAILFLILTIFEFITERDKPVRNTIILLATIVQFATFFWLQSYL
ncbi:hypothetical protein NDK47_23845 [Brevibacillus ruminantium]|uniref:Uncharacterized protein n=1 Tax=Brevibacillus ruminantium TaxID=2950604 RepID=A0ABY4WIE7_9BACL|nr:hypothetical protein [Brevibacillus ruminantium]USG65119.1 hypothetical protein NDK47_23845 [Brevibacillus ruminantium]